MKLSLLRPAVVLTLVAFLVAGCAALAGRPPAARIAFDSDSFIYTIRPDGSDAVRVSHAGSSGNPQFSPNLRRLAYERFPGIYVATRDGSHNRLLAGDGYEPRWSPDGDKLVFHIYRTDGDVAIYSINRDGTERTELTNGWINYMPAWSPDGSRIVFVRDAGLPQLWTMDADGSRARPLARASGVEDFNPEFSPDGTRVLFTRSRAYGYKCLSRSEIFVTNADGSGESTNLTKTCSRRETTPHWSPDGSTIVFTKYGPMGLQIHAMNPDGTGLRRLTGGPGRNHSPAWSPDGSRIAFISTRDGNAELYVMNSDGGDQTRLTRTRHAAEASPDW
jgi:Tol biopolymer transport system component